MLLVAASPPPPDAVPAWSDVAVLRAVPLSRLLRFGQFPPFKDHRRTLATEDGTHRTLTVRLHSLPFLLALASSPSIQADTGQVPRFEDYPVTEEFAGTLVLPKL